ncbi:MAG: 50S ribosomal protein L25/general stress protein Ctc [Alphaproteobacteria bacterium]|nr:50S ribosomal protein L25/general stress protein Ctc [Alphaproteobacteria bacterium]
MVSKINITERTQFGKRGARKLRHNGEVPGVIYGAGKEPVLVSVSEKELIAECYSLAFLGQVIDANIAGQKEKVLPKSVSFHPVTDRPIHVDFLRIAKGSTVKLGIAVEFINSDKCPGIKKGGLLNIVVHTLECNCDPERIPEKIVIDLEGKDIGDSFTLDSIKLPEGTLAANPTRDSVIATLVGSRATASAEAAEEQASAA